MHRELGSSAALVAGLHQSFAIADSAQSGLDITGDLTLEFWLKPASSPGKFQIVGKYDEGNNQRSYGVQYAFDDAMLLMSFSASSNCVSETVSKWPLALPPGTWHHAAIVYQSALGQAELFVDGVSQGSRTEPPTSLCNGSATFTVGQRDSFHFYDGLMDEVRVWNVARTAAEVSSSLGVEIPCATPGLVAYWKMNGDSTDCTANGNNLQPVNGPTFPADVPF